MSDANELQHIELNVNGQLLSVKVDPASTLQNCLHHQVGCKDVRYGCGEGVCGACTILIDGEPRASCLLLAVQAEGSRIVTSSGLTEEIACAGPLRAQLIARQAFQCGYCACGILVSAAHHLATNSKSPASSALSGNLCRCTGYVQQVESIQATALSTPAPTDAQPRWDLQEKLSALANYPTDRQQETPLVGRILWSNWPSARILDIDTSAAKAVPGVVAVLISDDIPGRNNTGAAVFAADQPLLANGSVKTMADAVALVAGTSISVANEALAKIRITYEPSPPVTDVFESVKDGAPRINGRTNVVAQFIEVEGDVDAAFQTADVIVEGNYSTTSNDH
ncbi:MAG TPA: 2Fe-2S iron-sulfur cluster-binding protein, partial [Pyrinomonadaceae bacterium]